MRIPASDFSDRSGNECLKDLDIEIRQALEVQTGLAHFVFAEPGQELGLPGVVYAEVDDDCLPRTAKPASGASPEWPLSYL